MLCWYEHCRLSAPVLNTMFVHRSLTGSFIMRPSIVSKWLHVYRLFVSQSVSLSVGTVSAVTRERKIAREPNGHRIFCYEKFAHIEGNSQISAAVNGSKAKGHKVT